jgi:predicted Zn-dependent peptidase
MLPNGLTVVVHEVHKLPIVALNIWHHVGSKNEKSGKTGFAHLFGHLMFGGSMAGSNGDDALLIPPAGLLSTMTRGGERPSD